MSVRVDLWFLRCCCTLGGCRRIVRRGYCLSLNIMHLSTPHSSHDDIHEKKDMLMSGYRSVLPESIAFARVQPFRGKGSYSETERCLTVTRRDSPGTPGRVP